MVKRLDHIDIGATDAEEMAEFFKKLGYEVIRETEHHGKAYEMALPGSDGPFFDIHTIERSYNPEINHMAFAVDDIHAETERLIEMGAEHEEDGSPEARPDTGRTVSNFRDPDGKRIQLVSDSE